MVNVNDAVENMYKEAAVVYFTKMCLAGVTEINYEELQPG
jgi:hypothetical protein